MLNKLTVDVPDVENDSFTTKVHWMVKNIVASPTETIIRPENGETVLEYLPPHPFKGMAYHRYPIFVFEQPNDQFLATRIGLPAQEPPQPNSIPTVSSSPDSIFVTPSPATGARTYATESPPRSRYLWSALRRDRFNLRAWANELGMKPVGAHLVRCEYDEHVPGILASLGLPERAFKRIRSEETSVGDFREV
jgi:Phosphatidylethanolamine-binding protein